MTHKTFQEHAPARAERPAVPIGVAHPSQGRAGREKAIIELTDTDLRVVSGGGSTPGIGVGSEQ